MADSNRIRTKEDQESNQLETLINPCHPEMHSRDLGVTQLDPNWNFHLIRALITAEQWTEC